MSVGLNIEQFLAKGKEWPDGFLYQRDREIIALARPDLGRELIIYDQMADTHHGPSARR